MDLLRTRRALILLAVAGGLCWAAAIALIAGGELVALAPLSPLRLIFYALLLVAAALTFVPVATRMQLRGLAFEGIAGSVLLGYTLAFVPPPTGWLLSLPDMPVYLLFALAVFWSVSACAFPPLFALGQSLFANRARQFDQARARRQAHMVGVVVAAAVALAALRVLTPISFLLVILIALVSEILFLSRVETAP